MKYQSTTYAAAFLGAVEEKKFSPEMARRFFSLIRKNGDTEEITKVIEQIGVLFRKKNNITKVMVTSARDVSSEIEQRLRKQFGKNAEIGFSIRPEIIGGVVFTINDETVIDASVKRRMERLFAKR